MVKKSTVWTATLIIATFIFCFFKPIVMAGKIDPDTLRVAEMWEIEGLDPAKHGTFVKEKALIAETLVDAAPDFSLTPGLAESWRMITDTAWEFKLRPGVKFHNGTPLTAGAVAWCLNRTLEANPSVKQMTQIKKVSAVGDMAVKVETKRLLPSLPAMMVYADLAIIAPDSPQNEQGVIVHPIGTGPYRLKEWQRSQHKVRLEQFNDYWGPKPKIANIVFRSVPDPATRSLEIQKGALDLIPDAPYGDLEMLRMKGLNVVIASTARVYQLNFGSLDSTPFADKKVRQALSYAINREEIVRYILFGMGRPAAGAYEDTMVFANDELKPFEFDLQKAQSLLAEAGWKDSDGDGIVEKDGQKFVTTLYTYPQRPGLKPMAMAIQQQWRRVGIKADVRVMDWSAIGKTMQPGDVRLAAFSTAMIPDPDYYLRRIYSKDGGYNTWKYSNPEVEDLLAKGTRERDRRKRLEIYKRIQKIVFEDLPIIHVSYYGVNIVMKQQVKGFVFNPVAHDYMLNTGMYIER